MSFAYRAIGWIEDENEFSLINVEIRLKKRFPASQLSRDTNNISLSVKDWGAHLHFSDESHVGQEAEEFPRLFPNCSRSSEIARCRKRIEINCPEESSAMKHFNDYVFVCQAVEFKGVILVDLASGELL